MLIYNENKTVNSLSFV